MTVRTDIHRPSAIQPEEYEFVAFDYIKIGESGNILADCAYLKAQREIKAAHFAQTGGKYSTHEHGGSCYICGASAIYTVTFYHRKTNSYIRTGQDCAAKLEMSYGDFNKFKKAIGFYLEAVAGKKKAAATLEAAGLSRAWELYVADYESLPGAPRRMPDSSCHACGYIVPSVDASDHLCADCRTAGNKPKVWKDVYNEELTVRDIVGKLVRYGSISDKALDFLRTLLGRIDDRPALAAQKETERAAAADCPTGRMEITATVLGLKVVEGYGGRDETKVLMVTDAGYKIFGSRFMNADKGDKVKFTATLKPSPADAKFGYFKRPAKPSFIWPDAADNAEITCPTCEGNSSACGFCGGTHKITIGAAKRAGLTVANGWNLETQETA